MEQGKQGSHTHTYMTSSTRRGGGGVVCIIAHALLLAHQSGKSSLLEALIDNHPFLTRIDLGVGDPPFALRGRGHGLVAVIMGLPPKQSTLRVRAVGAVCFATHFRHFNLHFPRSRVGRKSSCPSFFLGTFDAAGFPIVHVRNQALRPRSTS